MNNPGRFGNVADILGDTTDADEEPILTRPATPTAKTLDSGAQVVESRKKVRKTPAAKREQELIHVSVESRIRQTAPELARQRGEVLANLIILGTPLLGDATSTATMQSDLPLSRPRPSGGRMFWQIRISPEQRAWLDKKRGHVPLSTYAGDALTAFVTKHTKEN